MSQFGVGSLLKGSIERGQSPLNIESALTPFKTLSIGKKIPNLSIRLGILAGCF
jgi:hypothetical protein